MFNALKMAYYVELFEATKFHDVPLAYRSNCGLFSRASFNHGQWIFGHRDYKAIRLRNFNFSLHPTANNFQNAGEALRFLFLSFFSSSSTHFLGIKYTRSKAHKQGSLSLRIHFFSNQQPWLLQSSLPPGHRLSSLYEVTCQLSFKHCSPKVQHPKQQHFLNIFQHLYSHTSEPSHPKFSSALPFLSF